jgi:metal transporter CNNM
MDFLLWLGIAFCISQSAVFSGSNLAFFSVSKLRLELEASKNNHNAKRVLAFRQDSNFLLTTILWGNVGINVLLTLLSNSVMAGLAAFLFSTILITFLGEIVPQAYFSRHAIQTAGYLSPIIRVYQFLLYPVAKPTAWILDQWLGKEGIHYFREADLKQVIRLHMEADEAEVEFIEGAGAINFLKLDDLTVLQEGELIHPDSIITAETDSQGEVVFPETIRSPQHPFLVSIDKSGKKWVVLVDRSRKPQLVLDADGYLRSAIYGGQRHNPLSFCHRPVIVYEPDIRLGDVMHNLQLDPQHEGDDVIDHDIILVWTENDKRVITGADILGRLLRGIVTTSREAAATR